MNPTTEIAALQTEINAMSVPGGMLSNENVQPQPYPTNISTSGNKIQRIVVPQRVIGGGMDFKFETDPYGVKLHNIISPEQYTDAITILDEHIKPSRAKKIDVALLASGALMLPLGVWGIRHARQQKRRKRLLKEAIDEFNAGYPHLLMRWNRRPESSLTIELRKLEQRKETEVSVAPIMMMPNNNFDVFN